MGTPKLVEHFPVSAGSIDDAVRDDVVAVYIRGEYAGRLCHTRGRGWGCDSELADRIPWPRGSRTYFASADAGCSTIRRRLQDAEREERWRRREARA